MSASAIPARRVRAAAMSVLGALVVAVGSSGAAVEPSAEEVEFFERRIRPVLAQDCYECHREGEKVRGGLALDSRAGWMAGGDSGAVIVPGDPQASQLLKMIRHEVDDEDLRMPKAGAKLEAEVLDDFETWIAMGAPDPRDAPSSAEQVAEDTEWQAVLERRKSWWSFQPVSDPVPPEVDDDDWSRTTVDRFVRARLDVEGMAPSKPASAEVLVRRLYFTLIGLPPTADEVADFVAAHGKNAETATRALVDRLLGDPRFGERWARHWMDWMRYAESHGSEGDPAIPNAWRYRDYLIRAWNADVPYDQLLREHVAGDLLESPRIDGELSLNESAIGAAHWRFVQHGFAPTDALDEQVRNIDDQIDAFSKTFQGLTVSCARCHDHKFDAISQADFYALYGILKTCRPAQITADAPDVLARHRDELQALKPKLREVLGTHWASAASRKDLTERLLERSEKIEAAKGGLRDLTRTLADAAEDSKGPERGWQRVHLQWQEEFERAEAWRRSEPERRWNFTQAGDVTEWVMDGEGLSDGASPSGEFSLWPDGERVVRGIYPAGVYSHTLSDKHRGVLQSPYFDLDGEYEVWITMAGHGGSPARYVVRNYPRRGTVYPIVSLATAGEWNRQRWALDYWDGERLFVEVTTAADSAVLGKADQARSWFGVREVVVRTIPQGEEGVSKPVADYREFLEPIFAALEGEPPHDARAFAEHCAAVVGDIAGRWARGEALTDAEALLLDECLRRELLPNRIAELESAGSLLTDYRALESEVPVATRVPGVLESGGEDQALFVRGNHHQPGEMVPRRFLEAVDATPYGSAASGRRELAEDLLRADNPFTARVLVNRIWHHLFGAGLVRTPDNFGRLGEKPTHPELLDHLASQLVAEGWSMKALIRELVLSLTWQLSSTPTALAAEIDPDNRLWSHARLRRLEAEAIRDGLLAVSGELDAHQFGPPADGNTRRRAIYIQQKRNSLDPFLAAFDAPVPTHAKGRRDVTNVPAQSLAMMNGDFVRQRAAAWGRAMAANVAEGQSSVVVIEAMFRSALGRPPTVDESEGALALLEAVQSEAEGQDEVLAHLDDAINHLQRELAALEAPVRERLEADLEVQRAEAEAGVEAPVDVSTLGAISEWLFEVDGRDTAGPSDAQLHGGARIEDGALVLDGSGFAATAALPVDLRAKSLEAWVQLDGLDQRGGGVVGVQDLSGHGFDTIVWAEKQVGHWLAGSDHLQRTLDFGGTPETRAAGEPVHVVLSYAADGTIRAYRNGEPYGKPIRKAESRTFPAEESQVIFGLRHGKAAAGNRALKGRILEARLYERALSGKEVASLAMGAGASPAAVREEQVVAALSSDQQAQREAWLAEVESLKTQRENLQSMAIGDEPQAAWSGLAHALFNLKEFVYLR